MAQKIGMWYLSKPIKTLKKRGAKQFSLHKFWNNNILRRRHPSKLSDYPRLYWEQHLINSGKKRNENVRRRCIRRLTKSVSRQINKLCALCFRVPEISYLRNNNEKMKRGKKKKSILIIPTPHHYINNITLPGSITKLFNGSGLTTQRP